MISLAAQLTLDVCRIDSTTGLEKGAVDFFEQYLQGKGWKTERQPVGPEVVALLRHDPYSRDGARQ